MSLSLEVLAIQAEQVRVATVLDELIAMLLDEQPEFYSTELVNVWYETGDDAWGDRRRAFSTVTRHLRQREAEGHLFSRFEPKKTGGGLGRRYYSSGGPSESP